MFPFRSRRAGGVLCLYNEAGGGLVNRLLIFEYEEEYCSLTYPYFLGYFSIYPVCSGYPGLTDGD